MSTPARQGWRRRSLIGLAGTALGLVFLWLALRQADAEALHEALRSLDLKLTLGAVVLYWLALGLRVRRWQRLLGHLGVVRWRTVAGILVPGYAMNNLLPARLGELVRADLAKRRLGFSRSTVLGVIVVERMLDLLAILGLLAVGLTLNSLGNHERMSDFIRLLGQGTLIVLVLAAVLWRLRGVAALQIKLPPRIRRLLTDLGAGIGAVQSRNLLPLLGLTAGIWVGETSALWCIFRAIAVDLSAPAAAIAMAAASLSTLVPTAPAYLGSYQLVFATVLPLFSESAAAGVAGASLIQLFLFGSVTLVGCLLLLVAAVRHPRPSTRELVNQDARALGG